MSEHNGEAEPRERARELGIRIGRLNQRARDEIINRGNAGREGMPPSGALHRGQPGKRQGVGERVHADSGGVLRGPGHHLVGVGRRVGMGMWPASHEQNHGKGETKE